MLGVRLVEEVVFQGSQNMVSRYQLPAENDIVDGGMEGYSVKVASIY